MPRAKMPDHFKTFEIVASVIGPTEDYAKVALGESVKYHLKWIRGRLRETKYYSSYSPKEGYSMHVKLTFEDKNYFKGGEEALKGENDDESFDRCGHISA